MRKRSNNEIKTPPEVVKRMIDMLEPIELDKTYLEICCWGAPFLLEILKRKLKQCYSYDDILTAYKTVYGYELHQDNLEEGKDNLKALFPGDENISLIVNTNLFLMDGLTGLNPETNEPAEYYDWNNCKWNKFKND